MSRCQAIGVAILLSSIFVGTSLAADSPILGDAEAGELLVMGCAACHGTDGNSIAPTFPKLAGLGEKYLLKQMKNFRDGLRKAALMMGQVDNMSDQQLADIAAFYNSKTRTTGTTEPEHLAMGRKIYMAGIADRKVAACSGCHSPSGSGNGPAGFPALAGQHAEYIESQLKMFRLGYESDEGRINGGDSKIMRTIAFGLSDLEIVAVSSYVAGLRSQ